jgi:hypothetical protein
MTAPVSSCFEKIFQDTGLSLNDPFPQCFATENLLVSLDKSASSNCPVKSESTIGHNTSNAEYRIAGT